MIIIYFEKFFFFVVISGFLFVIRGDSGVCSIVFRCNCGVYGIVRRFFGVIYSGVSVGRVSLFIFVVVKFVFNFFYV